MTYYHIASVPAYKLHELYTSKTSTTIISSELFFFKGDLGGYLGLLLGASLLTFVELLDLIFHNVAKKYSRETSDQDSKNTLSMTSADDEERPTYGSVGNKWKNSSLSRPHYKDPVITKL